MNSTQIKSTVYNTYPMKSFFFSCFYFDKKVTFYLFIEKDISLLVKFRGLFTFGGLRWLLNSLIARANHGYNHFKSCLLKSLVLQFVSWREEFHTHNWHDKYDVVCSPSTLWFSFIIKKQRNLVILLLVTLSSE